MKAFFVLALTVVAGVAALQDAAPAGEAAPEPYSYAYQTESHSASEQRDQQGRVTGFYTLTDADGRERRVEYVADEAGFRAKVATNEVGTKSESPANVELVVSEPTAAQYAAQYSSQSYQTPAQLQAAQYVGQQAYQSAAGQALQSNYARSGYTQQQQYTYKPAGAYGANSYYSSGYTAAVPAVQAAAYGGYGASSGLSANSGYAYGAQQVPVGYGHVNGPTSQYYSYRSQTVGGVAPVASGYSSGYRYVSQPAGAVTTTSYRSVAVPVASGVTTYSSGSLPAGVAGQVAGFGPAAGASFSAEAPVGGVSRSASRSSSYQGSSNYLVLQKRDADEQTASN